MKFLTIKNWREFQHYKNRNPPWIKLHFEIISSRSWVMLDDQARCLMVACMLIASKDEGKVPYDADYISRVCYIKKPDFKPLIDIGFFEPLADASMLQADACDSALLCSSSDSLSGKGGLGEKQKITLENLSVEHIADWIADKRAKGMYVNHDENHVLEIFKNYCRSKGKTYKDYRAALMGAFEWNSVKPKGNYNGTHSKQTSIHQPSRDADERRREGLANAVARLESRDAARMAGEMET